MRSTLFAILFIAGCQSTSITPDPAAPVVLTETQILEIPVPVTRTPPPELMLAPSIDASALTVLPAGQGDYGLSRAAVESIIEAVRAAGEQLQRWRAWASVAPEPAPD